MRLSQEKKLNVLYRVEPGCLGPDGPNTIESFCDYAEKSVENLDSDFVHWDIVPRFDKSLPEMEYKALNKRMSHDQAARYLAVFHKDLDEFEEHLHEQLGNLIEDYLGRKEE